VPAHWEVKRLKFTARVFPSSVDKKEYPDEVSVRLCNYTDVYYNDVITGDMDLMGATASVEQVEKFTLHKGDVIVTKDSETPDDIAISAYVPSDLPGVVCGYHLSIVRSKPGVCGAFVKRLFDSHGIRVQTEIAAKGLTRVGLSQGAFDDLLVPLPCREEQENIAKFLDSETAKIDSLIEQQKRLITLLQERRSALISAAVTGKIDVRRYTTREAASEELDDAA
jgi:type I restriction enzyme, S subunit